MGYFFPNRLQFVKSSSFRLSSPWWIKVLRNTKSSTLLDKIVDFVRQTRRLCSTNSSTLYRNRVLIGFRTTLSNVRIQSSEVRPPLARLCRFALQRTPPVGGGKVRLYGRWEHSSYRWEHTSVANWVITVKQTFSEDKLKIVWSILPFAVSLHRLFKQTTIYNHILHLWRSMSLETVWKTNGFRS